MKKRIIVLMLTGIILSVSACSSSKGTDSSRSDNQKTEHQEDDKDKVDQSDENKADLSEADCEKKAEDTVSNEDKSVEIQLYVSNDDATAFVSESVKIDELTPENIVNALVQKSVLSSDVRVLKCEEQTVDGVTVVLVILGSIDTSLCSDGVCTARRILDAEVEYSETHFTE